MLSGTQTRNVTMMTSALVLSAALALSGCSTGGEESPDQSRQPQSSAPVSSPTSSNPTSSSPTASAEPDSGSDKQTTTALRAIATAEDAVDGGKVFDLESDTDQAQKVWEAKVADSGGRQFDLDLNADGGKVVRQREDKTPDDDITKLKAATVPLKKAISTASGRASGQGDLSALEIDSEAGKVVWQISFGGDDGTTVIVDAKSGKVLEVGNDAG